MPQDEFAIEIEGVDFAYSTASKIPLFNFKGINLPFKRVKTVQHSALHKITLKIRKNRITTLLGKNGSGKTTLIKLICGSRFPICGNIRVLGKNPSQIRHRLGIFMGSSLIYHRLTARENLQYFGKLYGVQELDSKIKSYSEIFGLDKYMDQLVESFSFGMKTKLGLIRSMIHDPDILILDEPTLGIDLHLAKSLRTIIKELKCTILLTTHYMEEAEELSDDLILIDQGRIIHHGAKQIVFDTLCVKTVPEAFTAALAPTIPAVATI